MTRARGPQRIEQMVELLRSWQGLERGAIDTTATIMERTDNPLIRQIMEIIRNDSVQHHRVQQFLIDVLTTTPVRLAPQEMAEVWGSIEAHDEVERKTIELATQLEQACTEPVVRILLHYLIIDERKHDTMLVQLGELKKHLAKLS